MNSQQFLRTLTPEQTDLFVRLSSDKAADLIKQGVDPEAATVAAMEWAKEQIQNAKHH